MRKGIARIGISVAKVTAPAKKRCDSPPPSSADSKGLGHHRQRQGLVEFHFGARLEPALDRRLELRHRVGIARRLRREPVAEQPAQPLAPPRRRRGRAQLLPGAFQADQQVGQRTQPGGVESADLVVRFDPRQAGASCPAA